MKALLKQKTRAFLTHFAISIVIAICALALVYLVWYPAPLQKAAGVTRLFLLMLAIDVIIGPLLTFIVYKKGKSTLKFDLAVIAILQVGALIYGLYNIYGGKPAYVAYNVDRFDLTRANEIDDRKLSDAKDAYQKSSLFGFEWVHAEVPRDDIEQKNTILFDEIEFGIAPSQRPELYLPLETAYPVILKRALDLKLLETFNTKKQVDDILAEYPEADSFVPLKANAVDMTVLINKKAGGKVVAIVDLRPWK